MGKRVSLNRPGSSNAAESIVAFFVPPACREEVLGDLHERYISAAQYTFDALRTVPLVILSRIRRTTDPQILLIQAFALYLSFVAVAWFQDPAFAQSEGGLLRLAIPAAAALFGLTLEEAYAKPGRRPPLRVVRGPLVGIGLALFVEAAFWTGRPRFALPYRMALNGCVTSLPLCMTIRMLFPPVTNHLQAANAPATWLKQDNGTAATTVILVLKSIAALLAIDICGIWLSDISGLPLPRVISTLMIAGLILLVVYQVCKHGGAL